VSDSDSDNEAVSPDAAIAHLEKAVVSVLGEVHRLRSEFSRMDAQGEELEGLLRAVTSGEEGPRDMIDRLHILEEENRDLRARLDLGKEGVGKLLKRIKFLEEQR
jgi:predicted  nucleic acid-binding Zn-ribbon protein